METDAILHLGNDDFRQQVLESDRPVLVDFWAGWCQPCLVLGPTIDKLAETYGDRLTVAKVDIDDAREIAATYDIRSIPTVALFKGGKIAERIIGVRTFEDYVAALDPLLN